MKLKRRNLRALTLKKLKLTRGMSTWEASSALLDDVWVSSALHLRDENPIGKAAPEEVRPWST